MACARQMPGNVRYCAALMVLLWLACILAWPETSRAQGDLCGCSNTPNLRPFNSADSATYPPGTTINTNTFPDTITIPLPADGRLLFSSFTVAQSPANSAATVRFVHNAANTPVTLLVAGDVIITSDGGMSVSGNPGTDGTGNVNGIGGLGGPGGFRGGDGAYQTQNGASSGGHGLGLGGGSGGTAVPLLSGAGGTLMNMSGLLPLIGGSGGGGGASTSNASGCSGGGGGGGGGAILIVANGTITVDGVMNADGGNGGTRGSSICSTFGGGGSGGAIRLVANAIRTTGASLRRLVARGGSGGGSGGLAGGAGVIRLEAFTTAANLPPSEPVAILTPPGAIVPAVMRTIDIIAVNMQSVPIEPRGVFGDVDLALDVLPPARLMVDVVTTGIIGGTSVEVTAKPRVGGAPIVATATLDPANCDPGTGVCTASVILDVPFVTDPQAYVLEARATLQTP